MRKFGLVGFPLKHSFSEEWYSSMFAVEKHHDCVYSNYPVRNVKQIHDLFLNDDQLEGVNVTMPYKQTVIDITDRLDDTAREVHAVNVLKASRLGGRLSLTGFNTDIFGFEHSLPADIKNGKGAAIVLGTGGAAAAVIFVLRKLEFDIIQVSRNPGIGIVTYDQLDNHYLKKASVIVNATPLGMYPDTETRPDIDYDSLSAGQLLYDLVYNPGITSFMNEGIARQCRVMNGRRMLEIQAARAWSIWNDNSL